MTCEGKVFHAVKGHEQQKNISPVAIVDIENDEYNVAYKSIADLMLEIVECYETGAFYIDDKDNLRRNSMLKNEIQQKYRLK